MICLAKRQEARKEQWALLVLLISVLWYNGALCWWVQNHSWDLDWSLSTTHRNKHQYMIKSLFPFLFLLECFTSVTWQRAKTVQMLYRTEQTPTLWTPFKHHFLKLHVLYTTGVTSRHSYAHLTQSSTTHTVHNRPHEHLRHTHIHYLYSTQHANVQSLRQQLRRII